MPPPPVPANWAQRGRTEHPSSLPAGPTVGIPSAFKPGRVLPYQSLVPSAQIAHPPALGYSPAHQLYTPERAYRAKLSYASGLMDNLPLTAQLLFDNGKPKGQPFLVWSYLISLGDSLIVV